MSGILINKEGEKENKKKKGIVTVCLHTLIKKKKKSVVSEINL